MILLGGGPLALLKVLSIQGIGLLNDWLLKGGRYHQFPLLRGQLQLKCGFLEDVIFEGLYLEKRGLFGFSVRFLFL